MNKNLFQGGGASGDAKIISYKLGRRWVGGMSGRLEGVIFFTINPNLK